MEKMVKIKGFQAGGVNAGIKQSGKKDLALIFSERECVAGGVFTQNKFVAAPIIVSREHLAIEPDSIRAIIINSGNANACTGEQGVMNAVKMSELVAEKFGFRSTQVLVASTGIIGEQLPMRKVVAGIEQVSTKISPDGWVDAAEAIMTTDTHPKWAFRSVRIPDGDISMLGIAKGAGMIHPQLATMLAFIVTDGAISGEALQSALKSAVEHSFNCLSVDGDTSTNDSVFVLANAVAGNRPIRLGTEEYNQFCSALMELCKELAEQIAGDGEGATKLVKIVVKGARSSQDANAIARKIGTSLLVKTALFGNDPNWGRLVCAIGNAEALFDPRGVSVKLGDTYVFSRGVPAEFNADELSARLQQSREITITVELTDGTAKAHFWTCDISYDYVKINAHYHT
ncbi:bifunctional glutamate N-acetyltransferase/amino-acid acetyltransferase ArgJ [Candidatus Sumerlaeota bacterium]|nr:bifunctional glutamate N-acetyltransferase/amino-acid acetyltransferase ArgJ [Candidatus Sumerlaeota bacterium]